MENFTIESRYLELWVMKAAFYRPDYQKLLMCPFIKRFGWAFVSKDAAEPLKRSVEILRHLIELLKHSAELLSI